MQNNRVIAICGKGGAGKTVVTTLMTRVINETNPDKKTLIIDADPALGTTLALGIKNPKSIGMVREEIIKKTIDGRGENISKTLDYLILSSLTETDVFSLITMGRTETLGCFCPLNDIIKRAISSLTETFDIILIDAEAGIEQINRKVIGKVDLLIIVTDPSSRGLDTAKSIKEIIYTHPELMPGEIVLIVNRFRNNMGNIMKRAEAIGLEIFGTIPEDEEITNLEITDTPIFRVNSNALSYVAVRKIVEKIE